MHRAKAGIKVFALFLFLSVCAVLPVHAENPLQPKSPVMMAQARTRAELLLFFDEKDLVTATKRATPERAAPAIATVITAEEISNMGARNLLDVLNMVPGFGVSFNEWGLNMIEVRGIRTAMSEKVLIMIDGHSMNKNFTGSATYNWIELMPVENIKQIEIVRGPGSALYGANAFVATVNIVTRDAVEIKGIELKTGAGLNSTYKGNLVGGALIDDKFSVACSLDGSYSKGQRLRVDRDVAGASGTADLRFRQFDSFLKLGYGDLSLKGGYRMVYKTQYIGMGYALVDKSYNDIDTYWAELAYAYRLIDGLVVNARIYSDYYEQVKPFVKILPNGSPGFPDGMIGIPVAKDRTVGGEFQLDIDLSKENHLIVGVAYEMMNQIGTKQYGNFDPNTFAPLPGGSVQEVANWNKDVIRHVYALYLQDEWRLFDKVSLTGGVRYDHYSDFGDTVNPRGGVVWQFMDRGTIKFLYGQAFRAPSFQELYNINNPVVVGNPDLKPEKIRTYEAAFSYRFARWLALDINYFYSEITNLINWDTSTSPAKFANIGKAKVQGVETGIRGSYFSGLSWKLSYAFQDPRDGITGKRLPYVPQHRAKGSINYAVNKYINLHTDLLWTGARPRAEGETRSEMPAYFTTDLAVTFRNIIKNVEVQASVHNLFNKKYYDPDTSGTSNKVPGDFPRERITGLLTVSYKF